MAVSGAGKRDFSGQTRWRHQSSSCRARFIDKPPSAPALFLPATHPGLPVPAKAETFSVRLDDDLKQQVDQIARVTKRSRSFIVKEAVKTYVRDRATYIREIDLAVKSAESDAGHSGEQIFGWMKSWRTEQEIASPKADIRREKAVRYTSLDARSATDAN